MISLLNKVLNKLPNHCKLKLRMGPCVCLGDHVVSYKLPADWKVAHVFKQGDESSPCLCIVCAFQYFHTSKSSCEEQHGFRVRRCYESQLIITIDDLFLIHATILGFTKAFDKVPHE